MGAVAQFDVAKWRTRYPEFAYVTDDQAKEYFAEATIYHANDGSGPVRSATTQLVLLNMLVAHIAALYASKTAGKDDPANPLVGRIGNATEGSVSVQADYADSTPGSMAWFVQTRYGASYWQATSQFRTFRYRPRMIRPVDFWPYG